MFFPPQVCVQKMHTPTFKRKWRLHKLCGNTTEATTLLQQIYQKNLPCINNSRLFFFCFGHSLALLFVCFAGLMLSAGSLVHFFLLFFFFIRWFAGSPLKWGFFWDGGFSACGMPWVPWSWRCGRLRPHLRSDDGDLFQGLNDAPPLLAKVKK